MKKITLSVFASLAFFVCLLVYTNQQKSDKPKTPPSKKEFRVLVKFNPSTLTANLYEINAKDIENDDLRDLISEFQIPYIRAVFKNRYDGNGYLKKNLALSNTHFLESWREIPIANLDSAHLFIANLNGLQGVEQTVIETPVFFAPAFIPNDTEYDDQWHLNDPVFELHPKYWTQYLGCFLW